MSWWRAEDSQAGPHGGRWAAGLLHQPRALPHAWRSWVLKVPLEHMKPWLSNLRMIRVYALGFFPYLVCSYFAGWPALGFLKYLVFLMFNKLFFSPWTVYKCILKQLFNLFSFTSANICSLYNSSFYNWIILGLTLFFPIQLNMVDL